MSEMRERVARALHADFHKHSIARRQGDAPEEMWAREESKGEWFESADAAIGAMLEPTEAMIKAAIVPIESYRAMMRAALGG